VGASRKMQSTHDIAIAGAWQQHSQRTFTGSRLDPSPVLVPGRDENSHVGFRNT
jgi:hypothetical protein